MATHEQQHALKMLEQIAANFAWDEDAPRAAAAVASHLRRFWSPDMRRMAVAALADPALDLSPLARRALESLQSPGSAG